MKKCPFLFVVLFLLGIFSGCSGKKDQPQVVATTGPVCQFAQQLCQGTDISVSQLITENVSCLHDYTLQVSQMRDAENARVVILSGAGLEDFMEDLLSGEKHVIDSSLGIALLGTCEDEHEHDHGHHHHGEDPHIWLSPENGKIMARNICNGLAQIYPQHAETLSRNLQTLLTELDALQRYGKETLSDLSCRELVTFHDGFGYFAESFGLTVLEAVEEESGSEASAQTLKHLINLTSERGIPAIFTEVNGSTSAASVISRETGVAVFKLDMAMSGEDYFSSMYRNINTVKEALE